ncbi:MAG TPA: restriction endonuclease subunit S [Kribbella sp.]|uniref:restriction endonuclease subunit S n=1 Tax=Kribbella sp. TaxID=1871183 RepID=UPI002D7A3779|nr:restriction endonuclease subunit S [Kribbella sp.]HET6296202.1 restriction endonuclease subunit S [Kribbella sp.]
MTVLGDISNVIDCEHRTAPATGREPFGYSVGTRAVRNGRISLDVAKPVDEATYLGWTRRATPAPGDLIFSREAPMGQVGAVPVDVPVCLGQRTVLLRPDDERVDMRFLLYSLMTPQSQAWISANAAGTTVLHLNVADVRRIPISFLPELDEQRHILILLEDHLSRLDAAESYLLTNVKRAESWHGGFVRKTLWSDQYPRAEVGGLLREPMRNGRSDRAAAENSAGTKTLTLTAVTRNAFIDKYTKITTTTPERAAGLWLEPGDVLVQRSNTPDLVGSTARYGGPRHWAIFPDLLIRLRADESKIDSRFLTAVLRSEPGHSQLRGKAKGLAGSMPKIDQAAIAGTVVPLPEPRDQQRLLELVEQADQAANALRAELDRIRRRSGSLRRAVLAAAFSGRLTGVASFRRDAEEMIGG